MELLQKLKTNGFEVEEYINNIIYVNLYSSFKNIIIYINFEKANAKWYTTTKFIRFGDIIKQSNKYFNTEDELINYLFELKKNICSVFVN